MRISKLDLKNLPPWISERFDSILKSSDNGDSEDLINNLSNSATKVTINEDQSLSYEELTSLLQIDTNSMNFTVIESTKTNQINDYNLIDGMKLESSQLETIDVKHYFETMAQRIWDVARIVWTANVKHPAV
jgi:hypothetical protein